MNSDTIAIKVAGKVTASLLRGNTPLQTMSFHNDMQTTGLNVIATSLYTNSHCINYMYILYWNMVEPQPGTLTPSAGDITAASLRAASEGYLRVPLLQHSNVDAVLSVQAITAAAYDVGDAGFELTDSGSNIFAAGLVMAPNPADASKDVLFSAAVFPSAIVKIANAQVSILWEVTIGAGA